MGRDPGPCPICGAAHTACTTDSGPIVIAQLPERDAAAAAAAPPVDEPFTTATYRGRMPDGTLKGRK